MPATLAPRSWWGAANHGPNKPNGLASAELDAILASLSDEQRELLVARLNGQKSGSPAPSAAPKANAPGAANSPARVSAGFTKQFGERAMGPEPTTSSLGSGRKTTDALQ